MWRSRWPRCGGDHVLGKMLSKQWVAGVGSQGRKQAGCSDGEPSMCRLDEVTQPEGVDRKEEVPGLRPGTCGETSQEPGTWQVGCPVGQELFPFSFRFYSVSLPPFPTL